MNQRIYLVSCALPLLALGVLGGTACMAGSTADDSSLYDNDEPTGEAAQALTLYCTLGVDCPGANATLLSSTNGKAYKINMTGYRRIDVFATVCNPTGFWLHLGDSPTNDGFGGDGTNTDHDAEGYMNGTGFAHYTTWDAARSAGGITVNNSAYPGGCRTARMTAFHAAGSPTSVFRFFGDNNNASPTVDITSLMGMKIGYSVCASSTSTQRSIECDWEDSSLIDQNFWYLGINRTISNPLRNGTGVSNACIVLNSDVNTNPSSCTPPGSSCGDGVCGGGETNVSCPGDCPPTAYCGDGVCNGVETSHICPADCQPAIYCGDGVCNGGETSLSCPEDCGGGCFVPSNDGNHYVPIPCN